MKNIKLFLYNIKKYHKYAIRSAKAELKSEVEGSYLNWLWWIIEPLAFMLIYTFIFTVVFSSTEQYFPVFVFLGLTVWEFFNRMIKGSIKLISSNRDLVTKVYIPKYILLLAKSYTYLFKLFVAFGVLIVLMIFMNVPFTFRMLYFFIILPILYLITFGLGCILMHFGVFIEDLQNLTNIALRLVFYLSGVFYNINQRLNGMTRFILLRVNPIAFLMNEFRKTMIYNKTPSFEGLAVWLFIGLFLCFIGIHIINKYENSYAKVI